MHTTVSPKLRRDNVPAPKPSPQTPDGPRSGQHYGSTFRYGIPALFAVLGLAAMAVDMPLARWVELGGVPNDAKKLFDLCEAFAHGYGAMVIVFAAWVLGPCQRPGLPRLVTAWVIAGLSSNFVKLMLARRRPLRVKDLTVGVFETFEGWMPLFSAGSAGQSFPSGHTTTAVALALGLSWLFPRGRWLFAALALLAAMQRIASGYHYLSDTLWAAALGWFCAAACLPGGWLAGVFDRFEGIAQMPKARNAHPKPLGVCE